MPDRFDPSKILKSSDLDDLSVWPIPSVDEELLAKQKNQTNAYGRPKTWKYEPPEIEEPEPVPLTAEQIEEIRSLAVEEGFNQGKEEGFTKGYEEGKASGREEGLQTGHNEGLEQGLAQGKDTVDAIAKNWSSLIEQLNHPLAIVEKNVEEQLLTLVMQLTEAVILQEAKTNPDILLEALARGIKSLPSQEAQTQILLHPQDIKVIEAQFGEEYIKEQGWRLLAAPQLEPGSCQIENSTSNIDLRIKSRIKQVLDSFLQDSLHS